MTQTLTNRDTVLDEIHRTREQIAEHFGGNLSAILDDAAKRQAMSSKPLELLAADAITVAEAAVAVWIRYAPALDVDRALAAQLTQRSRSGWTQLDAVMLESVIEDCQRSIQQIEAMKPSSLDSYPVAICSTSNAILAIRYAAEALNEGVKLRNEFGQHEPPPSLKYWVVVALGEAQARADIAVHERCNS